MQVGEIMVKDVVTLNAFMSIRDAARILAENDISGAPVLDNEDKLMGILTESDILRSVQAEANRVHLVYPSLHPMGVLFEMSKGEVEIIKAFEEQADTVVMDVMTKNVISCNEDTPLNDVAQLFVSKGINRIPVVDADDHVIGIVTRGDIVRSFSLNSA